MQFSAASLAVKLFFSYIAASQIARNPLPRVLDRYLTVPEFQNFNTYVQNFESELKGLMPKFMCGPIAILTFAARLLICFL